METADLLIQLVLSLHGISQHIVSNRGSQFSSWFWEAFCKGVGSASLSSGYHPQPKGHTEQTKTWILFVTKPHILPPGLFTFPGLNMPTIPWSTPLHVCQPFMMSLGFHSPIFAANEEVVAVLSAQDQHALQVWSEGRAALTHTAACEIAQTCPDGLALYL